MGTLRSLRNVGILLIILLIAVAVAVVAGLIITASAQAGQDQQEGRPESLLAQVTAGVLPPFNTREVGEDQDEIDPEACATVVQKELEGPIIVDNPIFLTSIPAGAELIREQMIIKIIQACNVDDEIRPPNLDRDLDTDIEVFSIICEKVTDLSVQARCEILRVAQEENADFLESGEEIEPPF